MLDFFQGMKAFAQQLPNSQSANFTPFTIIGDEIVLVQSLQALTRKILAKTYQTNIQIKHFQLENSQSSCDELMFLMQEQDLFATPTWFLIALNNAKPTKIQTEFLKNLHKIHPYQKNYHIFLPHLDKATKESPWFNIFSKYHQLIQLPRLNMQPQFFRQWLNFEATQHRLELAPDTLLKIEHSCRDNLVQAKQIIKQLYFAYTLNSTNQLKSHSLNHQLSYIHVDQLKPYLGQHSQYEFSDVLQALWLGQTQKMLQACEYLMQQESPHLLIWLINDDFLKLITLWQQTPKGSLPNFKTMNIWGDRQKALTRAFKSYSPAELNQFWPELLELERNSKGIGNLHANIWQPVTAFLLKLVKSH